MATMRGLRLDSKGRPDGVVEIVTRGGTRIYLLPVETFPGHYNNLFLIDHAEHPTLFDVGTALPAARRELGERLDEARLRYGVATAVGDLAQVVISHAHFDHCSNAAAFRQAGVPIAIHELDARALESFGERFALTSRALRTFFLTSGVPHAEVEELVSLYRAAKEHFGDLEPDLRLRNGDRIGPGWEVLHVPGHCPGMICLAVDDVVLTADHLLARITPVQTPHALTPFSGLENYLRSLEKLLDFGDFSLGLGAHQAPIESVAGRISETVSHHDVRLRDLHRRCRDGPRTVFELAQELFGPLAGYAQLMAYLEVGAHVELLHDLGYLSVANLEAVGSEPLIAARYRARERGPHPSLLRSRLPELALAEQA